ncbi:hypothetical protein RQP46_008512 [Phenoliferia psychrophenolica]
MSEPLEQLPQLPVETWTTIVSDASLSYFDLKRISRVSHTFKTITESPVFDAIIFRGVPQAPSTLAPQSKIAIHPSLLACDELVGIKASSGFLIKAVNYQDERTWPIGSLACAQEFATSPPLTHLAITDIGDEETWVAHEVSGVTVEDLLKVIAESWASEVPAWMIAEIKWKESLRDPEFMRDGSTPDLPDIWASMDSEHELGVASPSDYC